ncbi:MAG: hypothetical protein SGCHY_000920 [Lobulomycetales sp.]
MEERDTAVQAVKEAAPSAQVQSECLDSYPINVRVLNPTGSVVWSGDQRNLFRKYAAKRTQSIAEIISAVKRHL